MSVFLDGEGNSRKFVNQGEAREAVEGPWSVEQAR